MPKPAGFPPGAEHTFFSRASPPLPQTLTEALHEFVEKDNKESMKEAIHRVLQETQVWQGRRAWRWAWRGSLLMCCGAQPRIRLLPTAER